MSATYSLFQRWKDAKKIGSDNAGAIALGLSRASVSQWKQGGNAGADVIERMAKDLGEDPAMWAALVMTEQSKGDAARAWKRIARQLGAAAAVATVALLPVSQMIAKPLNSLENSDSLTGERAIHYAKYMPVRKPVGRWPVAPTNNLPCSFLNATRSCPTLSGSSLRG